MAFTPSHLHCWVYYQRLINASTVAEHCVRTSVAGQEGLAILEMSPRQARTLHRLVAEYNIGGERTGSTSARVEPNLEDALLRLVSRFLSDA